MQDYYWDKDGDDKCRISFADCRIVRVWVATNNKTRRQDEMITLERKGTRFSMTYPRYVMSLHLDRQILTSEHVHHIDGNTLNNDPSNLQVMDCREHARLHVKLRRTK